MAHEFDKIMEKARMKIAVSNFELENVKNPKINWSKMVATFVLTIGLTSGLVFASTKVYDKVVETIWKEPESYTIQKDLSEEEKQKCISEEEAEKIGNSYLKKIGLTDENVEDLQLTKEYFESENIWQMHSEKASIIIDAEKGILRSVQIPTWQYKIPYDFGISREEARVVARQLLEKYRSEDDTGEYEMVALRRNMETDEDSYIWYADFYKKYGELLNEHESIRIGWVPTINGLYSLNLERNVYEENAQKITQEQAIQIATEKDKTIETEKKIKNVKAQICIKQMNENVYLRENFKEEYEKGTLNLKKTGENTYQLKEDAVFYKTEKRVRKVWCVVVEYDVPEDGGTMADYTYYVDSTTGEIIGGNRSDELWAEEQTRKDPYNLIEK